MFCFSFSNYSCTILISCSIGLYFFKYFPFMRKILWSSFNSLKRLLIFAMVPPSWETTFPRFDFSYPLAEWLSTPNTLERIALISLFYYRPSPLFPSASQGLIVLLTFLHPNQPIHLTSYSNNGLLEFRIAFEFWSIGAKFRLVIQHHDQMSI